MLGRWCEASVHGKASKIFYHPSFAGTGHCPDFFDGITVSQNGFSDDRPVDRCDEYVFDKINRTENGYLISAYCEKAFSGFDPDKDGDDLAGTWLLQSVHNEVLIATRMPEGRNRPQGTLPRARKGPLQTKGTAHADWYGNFRHCAAEKYFSKDSQMVSSVGDQTEVWLDLNDVLELQRHIPLLKMHRILEMCCRP